MHFPMLTWLVTLVGLVTVACAVPTISARVQGRGPQYGLSFLNQKDPVSSLESPANTAVGLPTKFKEFFNSEAISTAVKVANTRNLEPVWVVTAHDNTYQAHINEPIPIYARFVGGTKCKHDTNCMAIVVDKSLGMISMPTKLLYQVGNPAIVSFKHFTTAPTLQETPSKSMEALAVHWLFNTAEVEVNGAKVKVHNALGFTGNPKIVYVDTVPDGDMDTLLFSFYGGTECLTRMPCTVSIQHKTDPEPLGTFEATIHRQKLLLVETKLSPTDIGWTR